MEYLVDDKKYSFSYEEIREEYERFCDMDDDQFMEELPAALHLACFICYLKEIPTYLCLSDTGIIHELVHLLHIADEPLIDLKAIRELFEKRLKIA